MHIGGASAVESLRSTGPGLPRLVFTGVQNRVGATGGANVNKKNYLFCWMASLSAVAYRDSVNGVVKKTHISDLLLVGLGSPLMSCE